MRLMSVLHRVRTGLLHAAQRWKSPTLSGLLQYLISCFITTLQAGEKCGCGSGDSGCRVCRRCSKCCTGNLPAVVASPAAAEESSLDPTLAAVDDSLLFGSKRYCHVGSLLRILEPTLLTAFNDIKVAQVVCQ